MKVVLFCGGLGMRLRDYSERVPKPLIDVGPRPIVWHLMKYYAHYGHRSSSSASATADARSRSTSSPTTSGRPTTSCSPTAARRVDYLARDLDDWRITFVDTGTQLD